MDDYIKEILLEAKKDKGVDEGKNLEKSQKKVMYIMRPFSKLCMSLDWSKNRENQVI